LWVLDVHDDRSEPAVPVSVSSLIHAADVAVDVPLVGAKDLPVEVEQVLDTLPDPRHARGRRHGFATVLLVAFGAVLAGCTSLAGIGDWVTDLPSGPGPVWGSRVANPVPRPSGGC
jgi:hypothetical protein